MRKLEERATRFGIDYLYLPTDEPILGKLRHFETP
jgi:hypothetical protein